MSQNGNPYDVLIEEDIRRRQSQLAGSLSSAVESNPDQVSAQRRVATYLGFPLAAVEAMPKELNLQAAVKQVTEATANAPALQNKYLDPEFAKLAHDDAGKLSEIEQAVRKYGELKPWSGPAPTVGSFFGGLADSLPQGLRAAREGLRTEMGDLFDALGILPRTEQEKAEQLRRNARAQGASAYTTPEFETSTASAVYGGLASTLRQAPSIALSFATGSPVPALASIGLQTRAEAYGKYRARDATPGEAFLASTLEGGIEVATELLPMSFLVQKLGKTGLTDFVTGLLAREIPGEQLATILQDAVDTAIANPDKTWAEYLAERPDAAYQTLVSTITQSAVMGGVSAAARRMTRDSNRVNDAEQDSQQLAGLFAAASQSKLRERDPGTFAELLQGMADQTEGAPKSVFIDAATLAETLQANPAAAEVFNQMPQEVIDQLPEALASGGTVELPIGELVARATGTPLEQVLLQNLRTAPDALSQAEAQEAAGQAEAFITAEAERVIAEATNADTMRASADIVKADVLAQLQATRRFRPDVNESYATLAGAFYTTMAARLDTTPQELFARYPLRITSNLGEGNVLDQPRPGEITVEGYHFSMADRPTLSTGYFGRGLKGSARDEILNYPDQRIKERLSFYFDKGTGVRPEAGVGGRAHRVQLTGVYDADADPLKLKTGDARAFETKLLDLGYRGYANRMEGTQPGQVIMLGKQEFKPELLGAQSRIEAGQKIEPLARPEPQWQTQAGGTPEALQAKMERMQANPSWAGYDIRIQDGKLQTRQKTEALAQPAVPQTETAAFKAWFGDSKVVDADGKPLVVYHGTRGDFDTFDPEMVGDNFGVDKDGFFFTSSTIGASGYADSASEFLAAGMRDPRQQDPKAGANIMPVYLSLQNPLTLEAYTDAFYTNPAVELDEQGIGLTDYFDDNRRSIMDFVTRGGHDGVVFRHKGKMLAVALRPEQIKSAIGNDGTFDANDPSILSQGPRVEPPTETDLDRSSSLDAVRVSPRNPTGARAAESGLGETRLQPTIASMPDQMVEKTAAEFLKYPNFAGLTGTPREILEQAKAHMKDNLRALMNAFPDDLYARARMWYVGGNRIARALSEEYGVPVENVALAMAALSPQKNWFENVTAGERVIDTVVMHSQEPWSPEMTAVANARGWFEDPKISVYVSNAEGRTLREMYDPGDTESFVRMAWWVRAYDEANNPRTLSVITPEGTFIEKQFSARADGAPTPLRWGSAGEIGKAIAALVARTPEARSNIAGGAHKVRSFFNNIAAPYAIGGDVTIDTHAVAAALLRPLGGTTHEVQNVLSGGVSKDDAALGFAGIGKSVITGSVGAYGVYADAYRELATEFGMLPREVQSITWEAVRLLFDAKGAALKAATSETWNRFSRGELTHDQATATIVGLAGGIGRPDWASEQPAPQPAGSSYRRLPASAGRSAADGDLNGTLQQAGNRAGGYSSGSLAPLPGAPAVAGASGPDPRLVAVAEQYAAERGIPLRRQAEYVQVDPERAARIASAYEEMQHAPQDPAVREAYQNLIQQTLDQYMALQNAGYSFTFFDSATDPYAGNPWNAMRDLRANQTMAVYGTYDGFGTRSELNIGLAIPAGGQMDVQAVLEAVRAAGGDIDASALQQSDTEQTLVIKLKQQLPSDVLAKLSADLGQEAIAQRFADGRGELQGPEAVKWGDFNPEFFLTTEGQRASEVDNPLLADTGLEWPDQNGVMHPVLANDLFRAVHDAFGHGLEGAGFRAQGEENAWQAHSRLFTGPALGAITTETRGQNSWLNYGPFGEQNRNAKVEDTVFADQKTGLMPEWTWTEGRAADEGVLEQRSREDEVAARAEGWRIIDAQLPDREAADRIIASRQKVTPRGPGMWAGYELRAVEDDVEGFWAVEARKTSTLEQPARGTFNPSTLEISLLQDADLSTFLHELGHFFLEVQADIASQPGAPAQVADDMAKTLAWFGVKDDKKTGRTAAQIWMSMSLDEKRPYHERWAESFEQYLFEGKAPSVELRGVFQRFRQFMISVYKSLKAFMAGRRATPGGQGGALNQSQPDLFPGEFATKRTTVETNIVVDSKGARAKGGNVNSKGQQVTATKQGLQRFWNWFEGSEATDDKGRPLVLYHSTNSDVAQFETNRETTNNYGLLGDMTVRRAGIFLTPDLGFSQEYLRNGAGQNVMQVYAALKNPLDLRRGISESVEAELEAAGVNVRYVNNVQNVWELFDSADDGTNDFVDALRAAGYDGAIFREDSPGGESQGGTTYVAFESAQIKSAIGNDGTFDANDPSILSQGRSTGNPLGLSAEIRGVFDRLIATDEQIAEAESLANFEGVFKSAKEAGMTPEEWAAYQAQNADATSDATEDLQKRSLADMKWAAAARGKALRRAQADVKEKRDAMRAEVAAEVEAMPIEQARAYIKALRVSTPEQKDALKDWGDRREAALERAREEVKAALLASPEAAELKGIKKGQFLAKNKKLLENQAEAKVIAWEQENPRPTPVLPEPQMETIAAQFGFTSGDELARALVEQPPGAQFIDALTEQRLLETYGDLVTADGMARAANEAVHNEARRRFVATELGAMQRAMSATAPTGQTDRKGRALSTNVIVQAAKQFAETVVNRRKVLDLKPAQHTAAATRAAAKAAKLQAEGKTAEAIAAKRDQLLSEYTARYTEQARKDVEKGLAYLKKFDKASTRAGLPADYLDQIDQMLERFELKASTTARELDRRANLAAWVAQQQEMGLDPVVPEDLLANARLTSYKQMTVEEFRALVDGVKNVEHLARLKSKLLKAKDKREFDVIANEIAAEIAANGGKPLPVQLEPDGRIKKFFKGAWADHRKLNSLIRQMDGGKDNGPFYRALVRSMNDAGASESLAIEKATEALAKIYAPVEKLPGGFSGDVKFIPEINNSLSRAGRLSIALNWGNPQNRQRVMDGDGWTEAQVNAILKTLTPVELQFVNDIWAHIDSYWPEIKAKQERVSGVVEDKVEAVPFELNGVQMRGGYYPIKYDTERSIKAERQEALEKAAEITRGAVARPTTRRGHTKARVDEVKGRPVRKDLGVITQHVNQVVHDLAWHEWFIDANRLLNDPRIAGAIRQYHGNDTARVLKEAADAIAVGNVVHQGQIDRLLLTMRSNVTRSIMGASLTTALLQPFGLTQSMSRVGVVPVLKGAARWAGDAARMESTVGWINEKSEFMRLRSKTFNRELREISQRLEGKAKILQVYDASLFFLMQKLQMVADVPTWVGAYEKALAGGVDESTAVALADEAVLGSQGGGTTKDLAAVQRNMPFLTQFYSYFNTTLNLVAEKTAATEFRNPKAVAGWMADMALLAVIPAILPALIIHLLKGGGEDEEPEDWAKKMLEWQAGYLFGMFVGLRELPTVWSPFDYAGPPAAKVLTDLKKASTQAAQGEVDEPAVLATINLLGTALGIPTIQATRSYKGWKAWSEGDAPVTSILFGPPPQP